MKFIGFLVAILLAVAGVAAAEEPGAARLSLVKGDVQIYTDDAGEWVPAAVNMPLHEGDRLWSPEGGQAEVQIRGGVYLRLDAATSLDILNLGEDSFHFYQAEGRSYINNRRGGIDHIQIDTPLSSVGCYDNSLIMVDVTEGEVTSVSVLKGYASAETRSGKTRVSAGQSLRIGADQEADLFPLSSPDRWERWNRDRDRRVAAAESLRYIPDELDDYASDLDQNGRWLYAPEYGYVWSPQLSVSVGWAPYQSGRWVWIRGDYVWISYEPWGWAPYHYGRWAYVARFGWCWVPPARGAAWWAPGYVGWVSTPGYVAWVPLAPGEVYYGYGHYGPTSVNITNVTINRTVVREYRNVSVTNAVTVVNRDGFLHGRRERVTVRGNPFTAANVAIGPPRFRPAREALRPVDRKIPPRMAPPEKVQRVRVEDIRRERRLVPEERGSVFRPAVPAQELRVRKREAPTRVIEEKAPPPRGRKRCRRAGDPRGAAGRIAGVCPGSPEPPESRRRVRSRRKSRHGRRSGKARRPASAAANRGGGGAGRSASDGRLREAASCRLNFAAIVRRMRCSLPEHFLRERPP